MSKQVLKREIQLIKQTIHTDKEPLYIKWHFSMHEDPHGPFGGCIWKEYTKGGEWILEKYAVSYEEELAFLTKEMYADLISKNDFMKQPEHPFSSYEKWLYYHRCKCGQHGPDNKQPFGKVLEL